MTLSDAANLANVVTAITAVFAVTFAGYQTVQYRKQQVEAVARNHYQDFLRLCIQYPEFSDPDDSRIDIDNLLFDGSKEKFFQYESFMWSGLNALESLYYALGDSPSWKSTVASVLDCHRKFMSSPQLKLYAHTFEPEFREFVNPWLELRNASMSVSPNAVNVVNKNKVVAAG